MGNLCASTPKTADNGNVIQQGISAKNNKVSSSPPYPAKPCQKSDYEFWTLHFRIFSNITVLLTYPFLC